MSQDFLPYGRHWIDEDDVAAVAECLRGDWLTTGPAVPAFEEAFAQAVGAKYAVVCANGTAALHLAALAAGVDAEDTCVAPTMSFLASANGMRYCGARIIFADADASTGLVTPESFLQAIKAAGGPVKMAVVVHLNGHPVDMPAIGKIADEHGITLVEDACHALGGAYSSDDGAVSRIGASRHSAMTVFSLHPVKTITMGEGGVVTTEDPTLYQRLKLLRGHGMVRDASGMLNAEMAFSGDGQLAPWYYEMQELGFNYRATDFACVLAHSQLKKLSLFAERRQRIAAVYERHFMNSEGPVRVVPGRANTDPVLHLYPLLIDFDALDLERSQVMAELRTLGIGTQVHYIPIHRQPYYASLNGAVSLPGADAYYASALSIPYYPLMEEADAERVAAAVKCVLRMNG